MQRPVEDPTRWRSPVASRDDERAVGDALAVDRLRGEDGVGVQRVEVAGDAGEGDEIGLRHGPPQRLEPEPTSTSSK